MIFFAGRRYSRMVVNLAIPANGFYLRGRAVMEAALREHPRSAVHQAHFATGEAQNLHPGNPLAQERLIIAAARNIFPNYCISTVRAPYSTRPNSLVHYRDFLAAAADLLYPTDPSLAGRFIGCAVSNHRPKPAAHLAVSIAKLLYPYEPEEEAVFIDNAASRYSGPDEELRENFAAFCKGALKKPQGFTRSS